MRKHFLILMLLTLLPLAGWAEDISNASVAVGDIVYGNDDTGAPFVVWKGEELHAPAQYTVEGYYKNVGTKEAPNYTAIVGALSVQPVGTYYLKISGVPENGFNGDAYGEFKITQRPLTIDFTGVAATYGDDPKAVTYTIRDGDTALDPADDDDNAIITSLGIQPVTKKGANVVTITNTTDAGEYDFDFTFSNTGNYTLTRKDGDVDKYVIGAKAITAAGMTVEMGTPGTYTYTGNNITGLPTFTVKDGETNVTTFEVKWFTDEIISATNPADEAAVAPKNAGTYYARVTGTGNYGGKTYDNTNWKITVGKLPLTVLVNPRNKTYDGVAYTVDDVEYTFGGLVDADQGKVNVATLTPKVDGAAWADFKNFKDGGYTVSVNAEAATIGDPAIALSTNYAVTPVSSKWTINQKTGLTITADDKTIDYEEAIPDTSWVSASGALEAEKAAIAALYIAHKADGAKNNVYGTQPNIYTPALKVVGEGAYDYATDAEKEDAEAILANYATPITINAGALNVGAIAATVMPVVASVIYDGETHAATGYSANAGAYILTNKDLDATGISYWYKKQNTDLSWGEWSTTAPQAVGVYRAKVEGVTGIGSFAEAVIATPEVQFEIQARPITITVTAAALHKGDTEANLEGNYLFEKVGDYVTGETIVLKPVFVLPLAGGLTLDENGKVTNDAGENCAGAVTVEEVDGDNDNANYVFTFVAGDLAILASELILDPTDLTLATKITNAAATGEKYNVTFANLTMKANEWYAMVLPFDIDPKNMVYAADKYVIFNELNKAKCTDKEFKFTLKFDAIEAGTPFLIKFAGAKDEVIDLANITDWDDDLTTLEPLSFINVDLTATINDVEATNVTFKGTYASNIELQGSRAEGTENYVWWLCDTRYERKAGPVNDWLKPISNAHAVKPMEAWLDANEANWNGYAPIITVEDFDGQTTSIKSFSVEQIHNMNVNGLYNLNGMKMQGVPTQKGVYIMNGKKVVIK